MFRKWLFMLVAFVIAMACATHGARMLQEPAPPPPTPPAKQPIIFLRPANVDAGEVLASWDDRGSGAPRDIGSWNAVNVVTPKLPFRPLGSLAANQFRNVREALAYQTYYLAAPGTPGVLGSVVDWVNVYDNTGSGADKAGSIWRPVATEGYTSIGDFVALGRGKPATNLMYTVANECVVPCQQANQLIYDDRKSGAARDVSVWTVGVSQLGIPSPDNYGTCRAQGNYLPLDSALNLCLKPACAKTIQLNDFELASIKYDMSSIDPTKSTADLFHSSELINPSPATLTQTVSGSKSTTRAVTMSFTNTVTNSFTIAEKVTVKAGIPSVADVSSETQVTDGFTFQFAVSSSASTSVQKTLTQTIAVNVPAFTHIKVSMLLASQEDVTIPFTATMYSSAHDWIKRTDAVTEQDLADILHATGFNGRILGFNAANNTLLIENHGVLKAAVATSVNVQLTCVPVPGFEDKCPQQLAVTAMPEEGSTDAPKEMMAQQVKPALKSAGGDAGNTSGEVHYAVRLRQWKSA